MTNCPIDFQILGITESRLKEDNSPTTNIRLPGCTYKYMLTQSANGDTLFCIKNGVNCKHRPGLNKNKDKELESIFIEVLTKNSKSILFGFIYKHPCMYPKEFYHFFSNS